MKKSIIWSITLAVAVSFAAPSYAQLAKRQDITLTEIRTEINKIMNKALSDDQEAKKQALVEAAALAKVKDESYQILAYNMYRALEETKAAEKLEKAIVKAFPKGSKARNDERVAFTSDKNTTALQKEAALYAWVKKFGDVPTQEMTAAATSVSRELIAAGNYDRLPALIKAAETPDGANYSLISGIATELAKTNTAEALKLLEPVYQDIQKAETPSGIQRSISTQYATALIESGQTERGVKLIEDAFASAPNTANVSSVIALSKGYVKLGREFDAYQALENHLMNRQVSTPLVDEMTNLYASLNNGKGDKEAFRSSLEQKLIHNLKAKYKASMEKKEAPKFRLRNMKGDFVSLDDMRGKIVVLDFWATWCGPCIVSFPGMQVAVNKYENDPEVEFLFIDTWQSEENYVELVENFIAENKYTFHVLYDEMKERDKATVTAYGVSGIPTKAFIDKDGFIRFQSAGGYADVLTVYSEVVAKIEAIKELSKSE